MGQGALGIIAGTGDLPYDVACAAEAAGHTVVLAHSEGAPLPWSGGRLSVPFRVERLGALFRGLRRAGVAEVVMAGAIHRPALDLRRFDLKSARLAPKLFRALRAGDDAALRAVIAIFEAEGFAVRGAHEFLPEGVVLPGSVTAQGPSALHRTDAARGQAILGALGPLDVGQACAVARGQCLGIETVYGTQAMLASVAQNRPTREPRTGGVFVKMAKPGQELRADMPVIGRDTVGQVVAAGLDAICLQAGRVLILDRAAVVAEADAGGVVIWAV